MQKRRKTGGRIIAGLLVIMLLLGAGCASPKKVSPANSRSVVDMAGRTVVIPDKIEKVYATGAIGTLFMYTIAPEMLAGWNNNLREQEKKYIAAKYHQLPVLGTWRGTQYSGNLEELLKIKLDLIINMGDVDKKYIADTEQIQKQLGIPVLMVDGRLEKAAASYKYMGTILKLEDRADKLAAYCTRTLADVSQKLEKMEDSKKVRLYYAEGPKGQETEAKGSLNAEILEYTGALNVADPGLEKNVRRMSVSQEQLFKWNPEVIIISNDGDQKHQLYNLIAMESTWKNITAVKNKEIYEIPSAPYDWINRPPSVNRLIGIKWLANLLYPEMYPLNIQEEVTAFFRLFYQYNLTHAEIEEIMLRAVRVKNK